MKILALALGLLTLPGLVPNRLAAQTNPRLVAVVRLAQEGLADSARGAVRRMLAATEPSDSLYPELLFTAGLVAATEFDRRISLRQVIVEYSTSDWADDALLLMGQVEYANSNPGAALSQFARLLADYPNSPLVPVAAFWGARAAGDLDNGPEACRIADLGLGSATDDVEVKNQLQYQKQRCAALIQKMPAPVQDSVSPPAVTEAPPTPAPIPKGFRVQVIAAPTQAKADQMIARLKAIGYAATTVREGGFFKVRAGPFTTRTEAQAAVTKIRARLGGQSFVVADK
jgi:cell division septation protein DedD